MGRTLEHQRHNLHTLRCSGGEFRGHKLLRLSHCIKPNLYAFPRILSSEISAQDPKVLSRNVFSFWKRVLLCSASGS